MVALLQSAVFVGRTFQQQRVACLQTNLTWLSVDTGALTGYGNKGNIILLFEMALRHRAAYQRTAKVDVGGAHLSLGIDIIDTPHVVVSSSQSVRTFQFQNLINLSGIDQSVATQHPFILGHWHDDFPVKSYNFEQCTTFHVHQSGFLYRISHSRIICWHQQFHGIVAGGLKRLFG